MTNCEYRFDCWHEDTCNAQDQALVRPGCWKEKGEGWKPEPDSGMVSYQQSIGKTKRDTPKTDTKCKQLSANVDETEQGELF